LRHPAKFTDSLLPVIDLFLGTADTVLDPFAGTGKIHQLRESGRTTYGIELEPEWAEMNPFTMVGDARALPFEDGYFDAIATSPTYGNRMADTYDGRDGSRRNTYRISLGHDLSEGSSAGLQWGAEYRLFHEKAWKEAIRVLRQHGSFVLNCKDHIRKGERVPVTQWHVGELERLGLAVDRFQRVETPGNRHGANGQARLDYEWVVRLWKP